MRKIVIFPLTSLILASAFAWAQEPAPNAEAAPAPAQPVTQALPTVAPVPVAEKTKILVTPFEYFGAANSLTALSLAVPAHIAERLEGDAQLEPVNGDLVLTEAQARLVTPKGTQYDLAGANRLARAKGAKYFLAGRFSGQTWTWKTDVFLYESGVSEPTLVGSGTVTGDMTDLIEFESWTGATRMVRTNSADRLFGFVGEAARQAFAAANVPLSDASAKAIAARPSRSKDAFASLLLGRAYVRYFHSSPGEWAATGIDIGQQAGTGAGKKQTKAQKAAAAKKAKAAASGLKGTPLGWAKEAAKNDPGHAEALRFYAMLLQRNGQPKLARFQYEFAIAVRDTDVRSLVQLGKLEMSMNNADLAEGYLTRATKARPKDGDPFYWLGLAKLQLGKADDGVAALETARTLQPLHGAARKELAGQYAARAKYAEAAAEFAAVAKDIEPTNAGIVYLQAACLRAGQTADRALDVLASASQRFPHEARMRKFRGDLLTAAGDVEAARSEYREAFRIDPKDARLTAMFDQSGSKAMPLGGETLLAAVAGGLADYGATEADRAGWQTAVNVAIADLDDNGEKACVDGRAPSYALLAQKLGDRHHAVGQRFSAAATGIAQSFRDGESAALTPDEAVAAQRVVNGAKVAERDVREMDAQFRTVLLPLYRKFSCDEYDGPLTEATVAQAKASNNDRQVTLPEYKPPASVMTFSPQIDPQQAHVIRFKVYNTEGAATRELTLDGNLLGSVGPGESATYSTFVGYHTLCLLPAGMKCGELTTVRTPFLHDGWTIRVRGTEPGSK